MTRPLVAVLILMCMCQRSFSFKVQIALRAPLQRSVRLNEAATDEAANADYSRYFNKKHRQQFSKNLKEAVTGIVGSIREYGEHKDHYIKGVEWIGASSVLSLAIIFGVHHILRTIIKLWGIFSIICGIGFMLAGLSELKSRASFFLAPRPSKDSNETIETDWSQVHLVTTGVYDYTRHPIYAGLAVFSLGWAIVNNSADRAFLAILLGYVLDQKATVEEELLLKFKPKEYQDYQRNTNKMIPFVY